MGGYNVGTIQVIRKLRQIFIFIFSEISVFKIANSIFSVQILLDLKFQWDATFQ